MTDSDKAVGSTADGLVVIRSSHQAKELGLEDPFAKWFVTEDGHRLVQMAKEVDRVCEEFNLARFMYTSSRLVELANHYEQIVFLGSGFDCRALWLKPFQSGRLRVYEVDTAVKLQHKVEQLQKQQLIVPRWVRYVAADLREDDVAGRLAQEGLDCSKPMLVIAEGLLVYIPTAITRAVVNPRWLNLVEGSRMIFDCWSASRVKQLNQRVAKQIGVELFHPFPCRVDPEGLREELLQLRYAQVKATPLDEIVQKYYKHRVEDEFPLSWWLVETIV
jgi:methyltransferase (TIGR00027 family)